MGDVSRRWQARRAVYVSTYEGPIGPRRPEDRMPPMAQGTVQLARECGHTVTVRENQHGSLRYTLDGERERTALELSNRIQKLHGVG